MRIMRQAVETWEGGIDYLADEMGLDWLQRRRRLPRHRRRRSTSPATNGGEFTTYPLVDPEIVVIATNPVGGIGIGVDPVYLAAELGHHRRERRPLPQHRRTRSTSRPGRPCPGFDCHHDDRGGTYVEDCGGAGGNVCFSVNGAIDPVPGRTDTFSLYDLVLHETGHCLTLGHVGDGAEGAWGPVPTNDIMAYSADPPGQNKCVSTLNVEAFAVRMSHYLDVDGDGAVDAGGPARTQRRGRRRGEPLPGPAPRRPPLRLLDRIGVGLPAARPRPRPRATPTTARRSRWTPPRRSLTVSSPAHGAETADGTVQVAGTVERRRRSTPRRRRPTRRARRPRRRLAHPGHRHRAASTSRSPTST